MGEIDERIRARSGAPRGASRQSSKPQKSGSSAEPPSPHVAIRSEEKQQRDQQAKAEKVRAFNETEQRYQAYLETVEAYGASRSEEKRLCGEIEAKKRDRAAYEQQWESTLSNLAQAAANLEAYEAGLSNLKKKREKEAEREFVLSEESLESKRELLEAHKMMVQGAKSSVKSLEDGSDFSDVAAKLDKKLLSPSQRSLMKKPIESFCDEWASDASELSILCSRFQETPFFKIVDLVNSSGDIGHFLQYGIPRTAKFFSCMLAVAIGVLFVLISALTVWLPSDFVTAFEWFGAFILVAVEIAISLLLGYYVVKMAKGSYWELDWKYERMETLLIVLAVSAVVFLVLIFGLTGVLVENLSGFAFFVLLGLSLTLVLMFLLTRQNVAKVLEGFYLRLSVFRDMCFRRLYRHANKTEEADRLPELRYRSYTLERPNEVDGMIVAVLRYDEAKEYLTRGDREKKSDWIRQEEEDLEWERQKIEQERLDLEREKASRLQEVEQWAQEELRRVKEQRDQCGQAMIRLDPERSYAQPAEKKPAARPKTLDAKWSARLAKEEKALKAKAREFGLNQDAASTMGGALSEFDRVVLRPLQKQLQQTQSQADQKAEKLSAWALGDVSPSLAREVNAMGDPKAHAYRYCMERSVCVFPLDQSDPYVVAHKGRPMWRDCVDLAEAVATTQALWRAFCKTVPDQLLRFVVVDPEAKARVTLRTGDMGARIAGCFVNKWEPEGVGKLTYLGDSASIRAFDESLGQRISDVATFRHAHGAELAGTPQESSDFEQVNCCKVNLSASPNPMPYFVVVFVVPPVPKGEKGSFAGRTSNDVATACDLVEQGEGWRNGFLPVVLTVGDARDDWKEFVDATKKHGVWCGDVRLNELSGEGMQ